MDEEIIHDAEKDETYEGVKDAGHELTTGLKNKRKIVSKTFAINQGLNKFSARVTDVQKFGPNVFNYYDLSFFPF